MVKLLEFLARHTARHLFRSSHLKLNRKYFASHADSKLIDIVKLNNKEVKL